MEETLYLFHHIHHKDGKHTVHHCGNSHSEKYPELDYTIKHCKCGKHSIDRESAIGHVTDEKLKPVEVKVQFTEKCPYGGWHIEGGIVKENLN